MHIMRNLLIALGVLVACSGLVPAQSRASDDALRITKEEAKALLGKPGVVFIDARTDSAWKGSDQKIKGAVRYDRYDPDTFERDFGKDTVLIVY